MTFGVFSAPLLGVTVAASSVTDLIQLQTGSALRAIILGCTLTQSSDAGDSEAELLRLQIVRRSTASTGTALVEVEHDENGPSATVVAVGNTTAEGTIGDIIADEAFNVQGGFFYKPVPEERIVMGVSGFLSFFLPTGPADALTMSGWITWMEIA